MVPVRTPVMMTVGVKLSLLIWTALIRSKDAVKVAASAGCGVPSHSDSVVSRTASLRNMNASFSSSVNGRPDPPRSFTGIDQGVCARRFLCRVVSRGQQCTGLVGAEGRRAFAAGLHGDRAAGVARGEDAGQDIDHVQRQVERAAMRPPLD